MGRMISPWYNGDFLPVNRREFVAATFARPADTDTYAAGDVISTDTALGANAYMSFSLAGITGFLEGGIIVGATVQNNYVGTPLPLLRLWLFDGLPAFALDDNAPFAAAYSDLVNQNAHFIEFGTPTAAANVVGSAVHQQIGELVRGFKPSGVDQLISGVLVVRNAYVPASGEEFTVRLDLAMV